MKRSRLKRSTPEKIREWRERTATRLKRTPLKGGSGPKAKRFTERCPEDYDGPRYGPLFRQVRDYARDGGCVVAEIGYHGPGHEGCGLGVQTGPTAHHFGHHDKEGLAHCCGAGHDLLAHLGSESTQEAFGGHLRGLGLTREDLGRMVVAHTRRGLLGRQRGPWEQG